MGKLVPCISCKRRISSEARECPKCGKPLVEDWHIEAEKSASQQTMGCMWVVLVPIVIIALGMPLKALFSAFSITSHDASVEAASYGSQWPYPGYRKGVIACSNRSSCGVRRPVATIELGGVKYGLNGAAKGVAGYPGDRTLMKRDPGTGIYELGASEQILNEALSLCD